MGQAAPLPSVAQAGGPSVQSLFWPQLSHASVLSPAPSYPSHRMLLPGALPGGPVPAVEGSLDAYDCRPGCFTLQSLG